MFTHDIETRVHIRASASRVWSVLTDFERYPQWNPFVRAVSGDLREGEVLSVLVQPVGGSAMRFAPQLKAVQPQKMLTWKGTLLFPGLFDGIHEFVIQPTDDGVHLFHNERFSGCLVPVLRRILERGTRPGFVAMNEALRARCEDAAN